MPYERTRTVIDTREFLTKLILAPSSGGFSKVTREVRSEALRLLRHYPHAHDLVDPNSWDESEVKRHYES